MLRMDGRDPDKSQSARRPRDANAIKEAGGAFAPPVSNQQTSPAYFSGADSRAPKRSNR
jgi:hypothetical protein